MGAVAIIQMVEKAVVEVQITKVEVVAMLVGDLMRVEVEVFDFSLEMDLIKNSMRMMVGLANLF